MSELSKGEMKRLRAAAGRSWERELDAALERLFESFRRWKDGEIDAFELSDRIHRFHDGESRDLYKFYTGSTPQIAASYGVAHGWIERDEIPAGLLGKLESAISFYTEDIAREQDESAGGG